MRMPLELTYAKTIPDVSDNVSDNYSVQQKFIRQLS